MRSLILLITLFSTIYIVEVKQEKKEVKTEHEQTVSKKWW